MRLLEARKGAEPVRSKRPKATDDPLALPLAVGRISDLFAKEKAPYRLITHTRGRSTAQLAAAIHVPARKVAKVVVVRAGERYLMAVLPSHRRLDLVRFSQMIGERRLSLAGEEEIEQLFPDCEVGAMPPLGNLYHLPVYVDQSLAMSPNIFFRSGSYHEVIEIRYEDFARIVHPEVGDFVREPVPMAEGF